MTFTAARRAVRSPNRWRWCRSPTVHALLCLTVMGLVAVARFVYQLRYRPIPLPRLVGDQEFLLSQPIIIAIKSSHFFGEDYAREVQNCKFMGSVPLGCIYREARQEPDLEADAVWFHVPSTDDGYVEADAPNQLTVGVSMEPASYYSMLNDIFFMDSLDIEMSYRRCAHVVTGYTPDNEADIQNKLFADPVPYEEKLDAIAYINSNCAALNGRNDIVQGIMNLSRVEVHSWGRCLRNQEVPDSFDKVQVFRRYKFCIAMENSNTVDYVTEKIWQAFESGCVPIYLGAPNILDFVPSEHSFIDFAQYNGNVSRLADDLERLMQNKTAYMEMMAWKYKPLRELLPGFRKQVAMIGQQHVQCRLCEAVMQHRLGMRTFTYNHCLRNITWLRAVETGGSTWGPGSDALLTLDREYSWSNSGVWDPYHAAPLGQPRIKQNHIT